MKKIGLLSLVLLIALGAMGVGYAWWSETLEIRGSIASGEVKVGIRNVWINDTGNDPTSPHGDYLDKDVGHITSTNHDWVCNHDGTDYYRRVQETVTNAYPCYAPGSTIRIANCGSIPVKIDSLNCLGGGDGPLQDDIDLLYWEVRYPDSTTANGHDLAGLTTAVYNQQINPCQTMDIYVEMHVLESAEENSWATWWTDILFTQWNAVPPP